MHQPSRNTLRHLTTTLSGASFAGMAAVAPVSPQARDLYRAWIADGCHADMTYLERYGEVRDNPALLLDGARTIIMAAFSYANPGVTDTMRASGRPVIAEYALGGDYHKELRKRFKPVAEAITREYGGDTRICIDTAPLRERYWAVRAGLGFIGINNYLIIPGAGAHFCLGAILWTGTPADGYDTALQRTCDRCGACVRACPGGAITPDGRLDARRCLSYLTIEHKGPIPADIDTGGRLFGCDTCRRVCRHEPANPETTPIENLRARTDNVSLTAADWRQMSADQFAIRFADSPLRRPGLSALLAHLPSDTG